MKIKEFQHQPVQPDTYEASMALNQLMRIAKCGMKLHNMIDDAAEMESWVAKKIDLAGDYVKKVYNYTEGEKAGLYDDDGMSEGKDTPATDKEIKMAKGIAFDKRYKDNYTGASNTIEKVKKGLSQQPDVADALKRANEDVGYPRPLDGEVAVKQFAKNNPDTKFLLVKKSNGKFRVSYSMDITPGGHKGPGEPSSTVSGGTNEFDNANDAIEAGKKNAADYHKERMAQLKEPREEEPIHPLYGDWGTTPEDWSDTHVANNDDIIIAIAKGKIPPAPVTLSGYMDEQNDQWPEGVEGGKYNDDQIVSMIEDTIGYECRGLGYEYFSRITFGEEKGMYKPTPEMIKTAQLIVKDPKFAKARARNRGQAESLEARLEAKLSEDAGNMDLIGDGAENLGLDPNKFDYYYDTSGAGYGEVRTKSGKAILQFEYDRDGDAEVSTMDNKTIANIKQGEQLPNNVTAKLNMIKEDAGEGHMSKSTLYHTVKYAIQLMDMINKGDDLEGWVQSKLNKAADYLQGAANYEEYQRLNPYREELDPTMMQKHAVVIQKNIDEILNKETKLDDIDTKPGMMRILAKRVNEVEKEIAKETRKKTKVKEDGHTDVPSAIRNCETIIEDAMQMKQKLETMQGELPSWMTQMIAVAASDLNDARDYLLNPTTESGIMYRAGVKKYGKKGMTAIQSAAGKGASHQEIGKIKDKYLKDAEELEEGLKDWARNTAMAGVIVAGLAGVNSINNAIDNSVPAISAMNTALEMAQDSGNDELAKMIEKDLSDAKIRLSSGKDLGAVAELQDKYAKFMKTEGLAYESRLLVSLKQQLK